MALAYPISFSILVLFLLSCAPELEEGGPFSIIYEDGPFPPVNIIKDLLHDNRDGKSYATIKINDQIWMAENLNYEANGSACYENQDSYCKIYGRLYDWETAMSACPEGWHLPSNAEWEELIDLAGGSSVAGLYLKAARGWDADWNKKGNGIDLYGFAAFPGGDFGGRFNGAGIYGIWWSSDERYGSEAYYSTMNYSYDDVFLGGIDKDRLHSVRCVREN